MVIKLLGSMMVVAAGSYIGFSLARRCSMRLCSIRQLLSCVVSLRAYINYAAQDLGDSLLVCARGAHPKVYDFFLATAELLNSDCLLTPQQAVEEALKLHKDNMALEAEECEILLLLGNHLGEMNRREQENYLLMIEKRLEAVEREATLVRDKNSKMYRYMGVCTGLMIVLLLI